MDIFDAAGLRTFTARAEDLFRLVDHQRVQLFPRDIAELERETKLMESSTSDTGLDPNLLLACPLAGFFYVALTINRWQMRHELVLNGRLLMVSNSSWLSS